MAPLGHAGSALRPGVLEHQDARLIHRQIRVVEAREQVLVVFENHGAPAVFQQLGGRGRLLHHRARGSKVALEHRGSAFRPQRLAKRADDLAIVAGGSHHVFSKRLASYGPRARVEQWKKLFNNRRETAGVEQVFHKELSGGLDIRNQRRRT